MQLIAKFNSVAESTGGHLQDNVTSFVLKAQPFQQPEGNRCYGIAHTLHHNLTSVEPADELSRHNLML